MLFSVVFTYNRTLSTGRSLQNKGSAYTLNFPSFYLCIITSKCFAGSTLSYIWETHHSCLKAKYVGNCKIVTWVLCVEGKIYYLGKNPTWSDLTYFWWSQGVSVEWCEMKTLFWLSTYFYSSPYCFISGGHGGSKHESMGLVRSRTISEEFLLPPFWSLVPPRSADFALSVALNHYVVRWVFS